MTADAQIGIWAIHYYCFWILIALILTMSAFEIWKHLKERKTKLVALTVICFLSLSEGLLFHVVYFGQYTMFYVARSLLIFSLYALLLGTAVINVASDIEMAVGRGIFCV